MTVGTDLVTAVTPAATIDAKIGALIDGINAGIQTIITTPGADAAAAAAKLTTLKADLVSQKTALIAACEVNTPLQPQAGVRPLFF